MFIALDRGITLLGANSAAQSAFPVGLNGYGDWTYRSAPIAPAGAEITFDNADITLASLINISDLNIAGTDVSAFLLEVGIGSTIYIQAKSDATKFASLEVTSVIDNTGYVTFGFDLIDSGGLPIVDGVIISMVISRVPGAAEIIQIIDSGLNTNSWQGASSDTTLVNTFDANDSELNKFLNVGTGEWDIPDRHVIRCNTNVQSLESALGRTINPLGSLIIEESAGLLKGFGMGAGIGLGTHGIKSVAGGAVYILCSVVSDDDSRPLLDLGNGASLTVTSDFFVVSNIGFVDGDLTLNTNIGGVTSPLVSGDDIRNLMWDRGGVLGGFLGSISNIIDFSQNTPFFPPVLLEARNLNMTLADNAGALTSILKIQADNGDYVGGFQNCTFADNGNNSTFMSAVADAAFDANPEKSLNFFFDVTGYARTQRLAELYIAANAVTTFGAANTPTDLIGNFILGGDTSGFTTPAEGIIQYELNENATYDVSVIVSGFKLTSGEIDYQLIPQFLPSGGGFADIIKSDGVDSRRIDDPVTATPNDFTTMRFNFSQRFTTSGDQMKLQIENLENTDAWTTSAIFWTIKRIA